MPLRLWVVAVQRLLAMGAERGFQHDDSSTSATAINVRVWPRCPGAHQADAHWADGDGAAAGLWEDHSTEAR